MSELASTLMISENMNFKMEKLIEETRNNYILKLTKKSIYEQSIKTFISAYNSNAISYENLLKITTSKTGNTPNREELLNVPLKVMCNKGVYDTLLETVANIEKKYGFSNLAVSSFPFWGLTKILNSDDWLKATTLYRS